MHALLGLRKMDGIYGPLQENWQVLGRQNMPESHRQFLDALEHSVSVRAYCLREWRKAPVELIAALEVVRSGRLSLLQMRRVADLHKMRMMKTPLLVAGW
ncbi:unnamed protein product [Effrenium voratum]|uniref:Uncharacterized protein n=1 Tax=Effrenium voratum TaxID=2562239 RepID=A0AA36MWM2_9DINO|nr:unnamed protein product [Effrenium voratum]